MVDNEYFPMILGYGIAKTLGNVVEWNIDNYETKETFTVSYFL